MPDFVRAILEKITGYGWIVLLAGLGLMGYVAYTQFKASGDHAYVTQDKLSTLTGQVVSAAEVTVTSKGRRGGSRVSDRYYELDIKPAQGEAQKLRLSLTVGKSKVERVIDEKITAQFDPNDENFTYDLKMGDEQILAYEASKQYLQARAEGAAKASGGLAGALIGLLLALVGAAGMFFNRKLGSRAETAQA